jgi:N-glycosidase YbiA
MLPSLHRKLARRLLDTGDAVLVERTAHDAYWGDGGDGSGQNRLGALLMRLRDELAAAADPSSTVASGTGRRRSR